MERQEEEKRRKYMNKREDWHYKSRIIIAKYIIGYIEYIDMKVRQE